METAIEAADQASRLGDDAEATRLLEDVLRNNTDLPAVRRAELTVKLGWAALELLRPPPVADLITGALEQDVPRPLHGTLRLRRQWFATPSTPGAATASDKVYKLGDPDAAPLAKLVIGVPCAICVHDGNLWVTPSMVSGVKERRDDGVAFGDIAPRYDLHLYRDGKEIPNAPVEPFATLPRYPLPKEEGTYRLTARNDLQEVEWTFAAPPGKDQVRPGLNCYAWWLDGPVELWDAAGNRVKQTTLRAFNLR